MIPEHLGSFRWWHPQDKIYRQWHVWATVDEDGHLDHIYLGRGSILLTAQGPLLQQHCTTPLFEAAWQYATQSISNVRSSAAIPDDELIDWGDVN